jgi:hypothetical protein
MPIVGDYRYRISGSARPFVLFWISRDNVGGARITRRRGADGALELEMLSGSDPARAPFKTNRWGYIREVVHGDVAELVAIKSEIEEETIEEARANENTGGTRTLVFIRERLTPTEAVAWSTIADVGREVSYRDLEYVLGRMGSLDHWQERRLARPQDARSGFLVAFTELMDGAVAAWTAAGRSKPRPTENAVMYVHRAKLYDLRQDRIQHVEDFDAGPRGHVAALRGRFRIHNRETGETSGEFTATYGISGDLAGVPLRMQYQPRWWLRTALTLDDSRDLGVR